jgi:hypothetical protein
MLRNIHFIESNDTSHFLKVYHFRLINKYHFKLCFTNSQTQLKDRLLLLSQRGKENLLSSSLFKSSSFFAIQPIVNLAIRWVFNLKMSSCQIVKFETNLTYSIGKKNMRIDISHIDFGRANKP